MIRGSEQAGAEGITYGHQEMPGSALMVGPSGEFSLFASATVFALAVYAGCAQHGGAVLNALGAIFYVLIDEDAFAAISLAGVSGVPLGAHSDVPGVYSIPGEDTTEPFLVTLDLLPLKDALGNYVRPTPDTYYMRVLQVHTPEPWLPEVG